MCKKNVYFHHYFHCKTYFFVFKVIVYMLECVCVMVCECLCVWVPAKFAELRLDPLIILCVGVDQGDEKDILITQPSHSEGIAPPSQLHSCPADVSFILSKLLSPPYGIRITYKIFQTYC
jgi:hypothetical protein